MFWRVSLNGWKNFRLKSHVEKLLVKVTEGKLGEAADAVLKLAKINIGGIAIQQGYCRSGIIHCWRGVGTSRRYSRMF